MLIKFVRRVRAKDLIKEFERRYGSLERLERYLKRYPDDYVALMDYEDWKHLLENPDVEVEEGEIFVTNISFLRSSRKRTGLKRKQRITLKEYEGQITTSIVTFIEFAFFAKKSDFDAVRLFTGVMAICGIEDERVLKAAIFIRDHGLSVFDAFHAAYCEGKIISSDSVYDRVGIENQIGRGLKEIGR